MLAALCALSITASAGATNLIKADNTTDLGTAGAYAAPNDTVAPTTSDVIVFDSTLVNQSTFSWLGSGKSVLGLRLTNPGSAVVINVGGGATYGFINGGGDVIDMSNATKNLTIAGNGTIRVRGTGTTAGTVGISVNSGTTLFMQSNLTYNNAANGTSTINLAGAGNLTVSGTYGRITDKTAGTALTAFTHNGTGTVTFSNTNTYSGGTTINGGSLVAEVAGAMGGGSVTVSGGTLDLNGSGIVSLTIASNKDFVMSSGSIKFNLGTSSDQIAGGGTGKFNLTGGTIELSLGSGFSYDSTYQLFSGFDIGTSIASGVTITGYDTVNYQATLNSLGQLYFTTTTIPEPSSAAVLVGAGLFTAVVSRRRFNRAH